MPISDDNLFSKSGRVRALTAAALAGLLSCALAAQPANRQPAPLKTAPSSARLELANVPLVFEPNRGQTAGHADFLSRSRNFTFLLRPGGASMLVVSPATKRTARVEMSLLGANPRAQAEPGDPHPGTSNYFIGNNPAAWRTAIPHFGKVTYRNAYPGIDVVYYGDHRQLEYDLVLAPGADPGRIKLKFRGTRKVRIDSAGDLVLEIDGGEIRQRKPVFYQRSGDRTRPVEGAYVLLAGGEVGFRLGSYDKKSSLTIDPVLVFSSYLGGNGWDAAYRLAMDGGGNVYLTGGTSSTDFPRLNAYQSSIVGAGAAFVTKISPAGQIVYSTYLAGSGSDSGSGIAVDSAGNAYITGQATSSNFPTLGAYQANLKGSSDAFVTKLNPTGTALVYSTYLGGSSDEYGFGIGIDAAGQAYVAGYTSSSNYPTLHPIQSTYGGANDGFVTALNAAGNGLIYSTYLGGNGADYANNLTVDAAGNAYIAGDTASTNLPTLNAYQTAKSAGTDGFVSKINPSGGLVFCTYLGGNGNEAVRDARVDSSGDIWVTGETASTNFPTVTPLQGSNGGSNDMFLARLSSSGSLLYSTYIGGSGDDEPNGLAIDSGGNIYLSGWTSSSNFPLVNAVQSSYGGGDDAFLTKVSSTGSAILFSTYLGGSGFDAAWYLAADNYGNAYLTGETGSTNFPTVSAFQATTGGGEDSFIAKIGTCSISISPTADSYGSGAASGSFLVTTTAECFWTATSNAPWITLTGSLSGTGNGSVSYSIPANNTASPLVGTVSVSGQTFTINQASSAVTLTSINPSFALPGASVPVTLTGTNFAAGASINIGGTGVTASNVAVVGATQITATFTVAANAALGNYSVSVTDTNGTTGTVPFAVVPGAPVLTSVNPNGGAQSASVPVTLTGSNFIAGATVNVANSGVTATNVTVVSATQITATLVIGAGAATGATAVTVTTSGGTSAGVNFTVTAGPPTLSSVNPSIGTQGTSVAVTLTGTRFATGASVSVANPGVTVSNINVASSTQITATFTIAANATVGATNVTVTTSAGASGAAAFTVLAQAAFTPIRLNAGGSAYTDPLGQLWSADFGYSGASSTFSNGSAIFSTGMPTPYQTERFGTDSSNPLTYTFTVPNGNYVVNLKFAEIYATGTGQRVFNVSINGQPVLSNFDIVAQSGAPLTAIDKPFPVSVTGGQIVIGFTPVVDTPKISAIEIMSPAPPTATVTSVGPNSGAPGSSVPVTITGTNLNADVVIGAGPNINVSNVTVASATQVTARFAIAAAAPGGPVNVTVTTAGGISAPATFNIGSTAPTLTSVSPNSGAQGASVPVTLTGANFVAGASVSVANAGVTVSNVSVVSSTQITATFTIAANATVGATNVTVTTSAGTSGSATFTVTSSAPTLSSVSPNSGAQGASVPVTLTGANFVAGASVSVANAGVTVSNVSVVSSTQVTATFTIAANATVGATNVTVTTSAGTSGAATFTVTSSAPTLSSVSPNNGAHGASVPVTLTGANFIAGASVSVANAGVTVSNVSVVSSTQITATFTIASNATVGATNVTVTTSAGTSGAATFTVTSSAPTLSSVSPNSGAQGAGVPVTLTGANFIAGASVSVANAGVTVSNVSVVSSTQITATFTIAANATVGATNVTVTTSAGTSGSATFTVTSSAPTLSSVSPNSGAQGASVPVTLTGANFIAGASVSVANAGVTVSNVSVVSSTQITATFTIAANATVGATNVTVTTSAGTSGSATFTVTSSAPTLSSVSPNSGAQGAGVPVTLTGANFIAGASVSVANAGVTVSNVSVVSPTQITATFTIAGNATVGATNVTVTTSAGTSGSATFTVTSSAPTLTSVSPNSGAQGASVPVTLTGANFVAGASVSVANAGVTVSNVSVVSSTQITATFTIASNATVGATNVTVTTSAGTSGSATFTVTSSAPTLTSVSPNSGAQGASVPVTLTGANFVAGASVSVANAGVTVSNVSVVSSTQITATFTIASNATVGATNVTITTSAGTSGAVTFTVASSAPTLTSVSPNSGAQGASVPVTLTGANFIAGASVSVANAGVTVSNVSVVSPTQITATFTIAASATVGATNVTVTTSAGTSGSATFTVTSSAPTLASISPTGGTQGTSVPVTLTGANFVAGASVSVTGTGVTVSNVTVASSTRITATFTIGSSATVGSRNVTVTTSSGASGAVTFTITAPVSFTPIRVNTGGSSYTDPLGQVWSADTGFSGSTSTFSNSSAISSTNTPTLYQTERFGPDPANPMNYTFNVPNGNYIVNLKFAEIYATGAGQRVFDVSINGQPVLTNFDIMALVPRLTAIDKPFPVSVTGGQIVIAFQSIVDTPKISAIEIVASAATPALTTISPVSGTAGKNVSVTLTGTNLHADAVVSAGPNINVSSVTVSSATRITATFAIPTGATKGATSVTVTNAGGTSNAVAFTIQ